MPDDGAAHRHPLALAAGEVAGLAIEVRLEVEQLRDIAHALGPLLLRHALLLEREPHVLGDVEVRVEGIVLEDHRDVPVARPHRRDVLAADQDSPAVERLEPREHPQPRGLAGSRRPDEHEQLAVLDREVQLVDRRPRRPRIEARCLLVRHGSHESVSSHLSAPIESPRIIRFCAAQPARTTGRQASVDAADSFARKFPLVETFEITHCGIVDPLAKFSCSA